MALIDLGRPHVTFFFHQLPSRGRVFRLLFFIILCRNDHFSVVTLVVYKPADFVNRLLQLHVDSGVCRARVCVEMHLMLMFAIVTSYILVQIK